MLTDSGPLSPTSALHLDLLMPLVFFHERAGLPLPLVEFLPSPDMPEPWQHLLVHQSDMTPRLREYHGAAPVLTVVSVERTPDYLLREVVLTCKGRPVEYGAIGIHLDGFPPHVQQQIREGSAPLGAILEAEGVPHHSAPTGYFALEADAHMASLLATVPGTRLYGRCNVLSHADGTAFADIVEVLPPG
jgi:chorismate-pyruvate lyase